MDKDPCPPNGLKGIEYHHHGLWIPVFLFLLDQGVVFSDGKGLVGAVFLGVVVHGSGGCECTNGDDFSKSDRLIVFGCGVLVPHSD